MCPPAASSGAQDDSFDGLEHAQSILGMRNRFAGLSEPLQEVSNELETVIEPLLTSSVQICRLNGSRRRLRAASNCWCEMNWP